MDVFYDLTLAATVTSSGAVNWEIGGDVVGEAETTWVKSNGVVLFKGLGDQDIAFNTDADIENIVITKGAGKITFTGGNDYTLVDDSSCGGFELGSYTGVFNDGGYTVEVAGDLLIANTAHILTSTGTWIMTADGNVACPNSSSLINNLVIETSGTVTASSNLSLTSLEHLGGTFNVNGKTIGTVGDCRVVSTLSGLGGSIWNIGGDMEWKGQKNSLLDLTSDELWYINASGDTDVRYIQVSYCDASGGNTIKARNSIGL